ncbi:carbohydrate ABC transporter permease [Peribacillus muralis]|uniref:carbohydrate ABC transporter permease n=1 Tax=Peribacillus muralis TaxID=264697 RepID=UPI001F4ED238|nr:carbohydrate ABC transporter permease [Peribacillus muralis]MCK2013509.1 carbohydrate ABC transporter permease [Peribacillus muralis]
MQKTFKFNGFKIMQISLLVMGAIVVILPFWWMLLSSFKSSGELLQNPPTWIPESFSLTNYRNVMEAMPYWKYLSNSVFVGIVNTFMGVLTSALVGYVLAKYKFWGKKFVFFVILATMIIPYQVLMIPLYTIMMDFGWVDSYLVLTIPYFFNIFGIFLMRQFMMDVPDELIEAAKLDGCSHFRIFFNIVLPVVKPAIATISILLFMESWDSFLWPLITINSQEYMTLPIGLNSFLNEHFGRFDLLVTASVMTVLPMVIVFLIAQKSFIEGISLTGSK